MKVQVEPNGQFTEIRCVFCERVFELSDPQPCFYADDSGKRTGDVCPDCFDALATDGTAALAAKLRDVAKQWTDEARQQEKRILDFAAALATTEISIVNTGETFAGQRDSDIEQRPGPRTRPR